MESFVWNDDLLTGIPEVDEQHHNLVDIINRLSQLLTQNEVDSGDVTQVFL
ncbi:MAG: hypothetical protein GY703_08080 [Gammaproteobacteria bacterium]|nr:hypothetical protein [Gammaproteobacteria bacterium]